VSPWKEADLSDLGAGNSNANGIQVIDVSPTPLRNRAEIIDFPTSPRSGAIQTEKQKAEKREREIKDAGYRCGAVLSSVVNTSEGRSRVEPLLAIAVKANSGRLGVSRDRLRDMALTQVDSSTPFHQTRGGSAVLEDWKHSLGHDPDPAQVQARVNEIDTLARNLGSARRFMETGGVQFLASGDIFRYSHNVSDHAEYAKGFKGGWKSIQPDYSSESRPWYIPEPRKSKY
jgi:hypothetical protein